MDATDDRFAYRCIPLSIANASGWELLCPVTFEAWWLPRLQALHWKLRPLGLPSLINGDWWMAATLPLDFETLHATRGFYELKGPGFVREGLPLHAASRIA